MRSRPNVVQHRKRIQTQNKFIENLRKLHLKMPINPYAPINLPPASGIGKYWRLSAKIIRLARHGCTNRPFYHIVVMEVKHNPNR